MRKRILLIFFIFLCFSCSYKEIKKDKEISQIKDTNKHIVIEDTTDDIELLYYRLVEAIIKKKIEGIANCYTKDAIFQYSDKVEKNITCFDGTKKIIGIENIKKNYEYFFKIRYLNIIEYEIIKIYKQINPPKIIFINLWLNVEFDFYEIIECTLIDKKYYISNHTVVKGSEIRQDLYK